MHASSLENMARCHARYLAADEIDGAREWTVVDVGGADVNGGYRQLFTHPRYSYITVDLEPGEAVDVVLDDPYKLPFEDASVDTVLSGQMLEHCEFFWLSFAEMMRVLKPGGFLFLIAPSAGPIHQYPVDCYRYYPDAYRALAKYADCHLVELWHDERGPWRDLVGVFSPEPKELSKYVGHTLTAPVPTDVPAGSPEEEATAGSAPYLDLLRTIHAELQPREYLEVGVRRGASLSLASCPATGVDPEPELDSVALPASTQVVEVPSDEYFRAVLDGPATPRPDLAFIDGMHLFEYALRDFMHVERLASPGALVVIDDIFPSHPAQAARERRTKVWTGDVWKLADCLGQVRPDLVLIPVDTQPTGLLLIAGLNPKNRALWERYNPLVRQYRADADPPADRLARTGALAPDDPRLSGVFAALRAARENNAPPGRVAATVRAALAAGSPS